MPSSGLFITLYDNEALNLYLDKGVYGVLREPIFKQIEPRSKLYAALADFACAREGTHVFFFEDRRIVYGGQIIGSQKYGSYFINGPYSPEGRNLNAPLSWDESNREKYEPTDKPGIFKVPTQSGLVIRCQPYLIRFIDKLGMKGKSIMSDVLYSELSLSFPYPLPSNSIRDMSYCTLTPGETDILIDLLNKASEDFFKVPKDKIDFKGEPMLFDPSLGISKLTEAISKHHFEASFLSNPDLLPTDLRPDDDTICRKVPITPHKPFQEDRADICYFSDESIKDGTIPNKVLEFEWKKADESKILKIVRYIKWLSRITPDEFTNVSFYFFAPSFKQNIRSNIPREYNAQINLIKL